MLSLFYMGLNGFPLMHACVNVRFPPPAGPTAETRVTMHTHGTRGTGWAPTHVPTSPRRSRGRRDAGGQTVARAGAVGTMEGCGVLCWAMGQWGEGGQGRTSWFDTCDEADD